MKYNVQILPQAWEDLSRIADWYRLYFDAQTALKVTSGILETIGRLETFPDSGSVLPDEWLNQRGYRMIIIKTHAAIYRLSNEVVYIYHIFDLRQDYPILFDDLKTP